jgi:hypothetical protein
LFREVRETVVDVATGEAFPSALRVSTSTPVVEQAPAFTVCGAVAKAI